LLKCCYRVNNCGLLTFSQARFGALLIFDLCVVFVFALKND
jgi:hypothetical protein